MKMLSFRALYSGWTLNSRLSRLSSYSLAAILGGVFFFLIYVEPLNFLAGDVGFFEVGDAPQHVTGWLFYAKSAWVWPLLNAQLMAPPEGINIAFTDSIPFAALFFKLLHPLLPENYHFFGLWHLISKVAQATGGVFLIRSLGRVDLLSAVVAATMALLWPASLARLTHTALTTHGILLFSLGLYFRAVRYHWSTGGTIFAFTLIACLALLVHPYFLAMVLPLVFACAADRWINGRPAGEAVLMIALVPGVVAAIAFLLGYASGGSGSSGGFSHFSMNVLSPLCGGLLSVCAQQDATGGQAYEGFNYLGAGTFMVLVAGLALGVFTRSVAGVRRHKALLAVLVGFTLYSLSNRVYLGDLELFSYPLPPVYDRVADIFRASGRFFWPVGYVLAFVALAGVLKQRHVVALPIILATITLQWIDTAALRAQTVALTGVEKPFDYSGWTALQGQVDHVSVSPTYGCEDIDNMHYLYFQIVAARLGASINTGYLARNQRRCEVSEIKQFEPRTLYVFLDPVRGLPAPRPFDQTIMSTACARWLKWGGVILCLPQDLANWTQIIPELVFE